MLPIIETKQTIPIKTTYKFFYVLKKAHLQIARIQAQDLTKYNII
jgi:hypothetical protein